MQNASEVIYNLSHFLFFCQPVASIHHVTLSMAFNRHVFTLAACEKSLVSCVLLHICHAGWKVSTVGHTQARSSFVFWVKLSCAAALYSTDILQVDF